MEASPPQILIYGLREVGASIGLALREASSAADRVGSDPDGRVAREALKAGAIDRLASLGGAAAHADLIVLAVPAADAVDALHAIAGRLKADAVVLDTSLPQAATAEQARSLLPEQRYYVGAVPSLAISGLTESAPVPAANRFRGAQMALVFPSGTPDPVARLAFQFAHLLGCVPFFVDASELDGVAASSEAVPYLAAAALWSAAVRAPNWHEAERLAGRALSLPVGLLTGEDPADLAFSLTSNRANVLAKMDAYLESLGELRRLVATGSERDLAQRLADARQTYEAWLAKRAHGDWQGPQHTPPADEAGSSLLSRLFLPRAAGRGHGP